jgi:hypothetical protein
MTFAANVRRQNCQNGSTKNSYSKVLTGWSTLIVPLYRLSDSPTGGEFGAATLRARL